MSPGKLKRPRNLKLLMDFVDATQELLDSENSTGCTDDLTVVSKRACGRLRKIRDKARKELEE